MRRSHGGRGLQACRADCLSLGRFRLGQRCQGWCLHSNSGSSLYLCSPGETLTRRRHSEHLASISDNSLERAIMGMRPSCWEHRASYARFDGAMQFRNRCYAPKMCKRRSSWRQGGFAHGLTKTRLSVSPSGCLVFGHSDGSVRFPRINTNWQGTLNGAGAYLAID